jgi:hypothetical protein
MKIRGLQGLFNLSFSATVAAGTSMPVPVTPAMD